MRTSSSGGVHDDLPVLLYSSHVVYGPPAHITAKYISATGPRAGAFITISFRRFPHGVIDDGEDSYDNSVTRHLMGGRAARDAQKCKLICTRDTRAYVTRRGARVGVMT